MLNYILKLFDQTQYTTPNLSGNFIFEDSLNKYNPTYVEQLSPRERKNKF
jgi:hypothetical protein